MRFMRPLLHRSTAVAYEFYVNNPDAVTPEALETEIVMPLKAAEGRSP